MPGRTLWSRRRFAAPLAGLVVALAVAGCSNEAAPAESDETATLRMLHFDGGASLDPAVSWFVDEVAERSGGNVEIELVRSCCGEDADVERVLVSKVADSEADLGWVGTRVFGDLGVPDLRALTAPMLLDSYALQEAVITSDFAGERLASVSDLGVSEVALVPGPMRVPLSSTGPLVAPEDWSGLRVHTVASELSEDAIAALGGTPLTADREERDAGLFDGSIQATDNGFAFLRGDREHLLPYATVNVGLWPRVSAIIGNPDALAELSDEQRDVLTDAAAAVAARTGELASTDATLVAESCERGARFAEATDAQLAAMGAAFEPVYEQLAEDPATKEFIERVRDLEATVDAEPSVAIPDGCTGKSPLLDEPADGDSGDASALNGSWTRDPMTVDELVAGGLTEAQAQDVAAQFTLGFDDGAFVLTVDDEWVCDGTAEVRGDRLTVRYLPGGHCGPGGRLFEATFAIDGDTMTFSDVGSQNATDRLFFGLRPWTREG